MQPDISRVDLVIQYALLLAGEQDHPFDRELGPIHLIKYVYLADLAHARRYDGATFTGIDWQFYNFGPWSATVHERIEPALASLGASRRQMESEYEEKKDWFRWSLRNDDLLAEREGRLPASVAMSLRQCVRKYGKDTTSLLHYVYSTAPMLAAAPKERLDFALESAAKLRPLEKPDENSDKKTARLRQAMERVQAAAQARKNPRPKLINPVSSPRYDQVYEQGLKWLDGLAGDPPEPGQKLAQFSDDVWKSSTRKGPDVS
jgi:hypothetical protein